MPVVKYRLGLAKKTARIGRAGLDAFVREALREFGGRSLLSNIALACNDDNTLEIEADKDSLCMVHGALVLCGTYRGIGCCFREM